MNNRFLPEAYKIVEIIHETSAEYTFRVSYDKPVRHGQFFMLSIPKIGEAPISVSGRNGDTIDFTIRKIGRLTNGIFNMRQGDTLFMRGPYGNHFPVDDFKCKDLVVIAGGTGVSPVRSTLQYFYDHPDEIRTLTFIAGFKNKDSILFREDLKKFSTKFNTIYTLDNESCGDFRKGFVTSYVKDILFDTCEDYNVVIVGPPAMISLTAAECVANGADPSKMWVSFERKMSCAVGKCGHCKINETYVCLEGPVFRYDKARDMLD